VCRLGSTKYDQLAVDDPRRDQILDRTGALEIAYNVEEWADFNPGTDLTT
jgi:hypothetical protein